MWSVVVFGRCVDMYIFNNLLQAQDADSSRLNFGVSRVGNLVLKNLNGNIYCIPLSQKCRNCIKIKSSFFFLLKS